MKINGHHHVSMYTKDIKQNKDFYTNVLGLRLVEISVNQDNPTMICLTQMYGRKITILIFLKLFKS